MRVSTCNADALRPAQFSKGHKRPVVYVGLPNVKARDALLIFAEFGVVHQDVCDVHVVLHRCRHFLGVLPETSAAGNANDLPLVSDGGPCARGGREPEDDRAVTTPWPSTGTSTDWKRPSAIGSKST